VHDATVEELAGFTSAMRERVLPVVAPAGAIDVGLTRSAWQMLAKFQINCAVPFVCRIVQRLKTSGMLTMAMREFGSPVESVCIACWN
jgi:hypothetical protein